MHLYAVSNYILNIFRGCKTSNAHELNLDLFVVKVQVYLDVHFANENICTRWVRIKKVTLNKGKRNVKDLIENLFPDFLQCTQTWRLLIQG